MFMAGLIALMVTVGGATRLTDSGLSITEWALLLGALPPMNDADWAVAFDKYRQIPEYTQVNAGMSLAAFKEIYWWEWGHRNLGRFIGLAHLFPLVWFSVRGIVRGGLRLRLWGLFLLICVQGAIGWYMVASGLSERVDVSQYRLALHLGTAIVLFCLIIWQILALIRGQGRHAPPVGAGRMPLVLLGLTFIQVELGAFVAGLRAGKTYNSWPLMEGRFVPADYFGTPAQVSDAFDRIAAVQFNHRMGAYILLAAAVVFAVQAVRGGYARYGMAVLGAVLAQAVLGIWTLVTAVPMSLGLLHQLGALGVLSVVILAAYDLTPSSPKRAPTDV